MANMSYCRFQNTLHDLIDCVNEMEEFDSVDEFMESLSSEEKRAAKQMMEISEQITNFNNS